MKTIFTKKKLGLFKTILFVVMLCNFSSIILLNGQDVLADDQELYFDLVILSANTIWSPFINDPILTALPSIGINATLVYDSWADIIPRTWGWPTSDPIPSYMEGGYDTLMIGYSQVMDYNYNEFYNPDQIPPIGLNYYSYDNNEMTWALDNYTSQYTYAGRQPYLDDIQQIMYDDLPSICILNDRALYHYDSDLTGWDSTRWYTDGQPMENWEMAGDLDFYYGMGYTIDDFSIHHLYQPDTDKLWLRQIYNGLADRENGTGLLVPRFASSYSTTDGITYTITIDPDTKWADGTNFTANDVLYNYQLVTDVDYNAYYGEYSYMLNPSNVVKVDNYTVDITFNGMNYQNEKLLTLELIPYHIWNGIAPVDIKSTAASWAVSNPEKLFGLGPYKFNNFESVHENIVNLDRNIYFTNLSKFTEPSFDEVHFINFANNGDALTNFTAGDTDMLDNNFYITISEAEVAGQSWVLAKTFAYDEMSINHNNPYFGTGELCPIAGPNSARHIRKAISYMIDRETIVTNGFSSRAVPGIIPMGEAQTGFNSSLTHYEYNLTKALWHMAQAGFPETYTPTVSIGLTINVYIGLTLLLGICIMLFTKKKNK